MKDGISNLKHYITFHLSSTTALMNALFSYAILEAITDSSAKYFLSPGLMFLSNSTLLSKCPRNDIKSADPSAGTTTFPVCQIHLYDHFNFHDATDQHAHK